MGTWLESRVIETALILFASPRSKSGEIMRSFAAMMNQDSLLNHVANFAGVPTVADNDANGASPRGMAIRFHVGERRGAAAHHFRSDSAS
jgi:hypothetical protein